MRVLILGSAHDETARAVAIGLRARHGEASVQHRTLEELGAAQWTHRLGVTGTATNIRFPDGTTMAQFAPTLVFNRLEFTPTLLFTGMAEADRNYARAEFYALLLSWLASLGERVLNRPSPYALCGPGLRSWRWLAVAANAGLSPYPGAATTSRRRAPPPRGEVPRTELLPIADDGSAQLGFSGPFAHAPRPQAVSALLVMGDRVIGAGAQSCGPAVAQGCLRLARAVGAELLGVHVAQPEGDDCWRFLDAEARPEVTDGSIAAALVAWIETRA